MKITKTDRETSLTAKEFVWDMVDNTEVHSFVWPVLERRIQVLKPARLLDIGCGNGALTARMARLVPRCVGADFSTTGIAIAAKAHPEAEFRVSRIEEPLPQDLVGTFDAVTAVEVIEHLVLPRQLFSRAKEALTPGGYLIVTTPFHGYLKNVALAAAGKFDFHWHPLRDYGHVKFFSERTLRELFAEQGFEVDFFSRVGRIPALARSMIMGARMR